jgi:hypothetical protein
MVCLTHIMHLLVNVQFFLIGQLLLHNFESRGNIQNQVFRRNIYNFDAIKKKVSGSLQTSIRSNSILLAKNYKHLLWNRKMANGFISLNLM